MRESRIIPADFEAGGEDGHHPVTFCVYLINFLQRLPPRFPAESVTPLPQIRMSTCYYSLVLSSHQLRAAVGKLFFFPFLILLHIFSIVP